MQASVFDENSRIVFTRITPMPTDSLRSPKSPQIDFQKKNKKEIGATAAPHLVLSLVYHGRGSVEYWQTRTVTPTILQFFLANWPFSWRRRRVTAVCVIGVSGGQIPGGDFQLFSPGKNPVRVFCMQTGLLPGKLAFFLAKST